MDGPLDQPPERSPLLTALRQLLLDLLDLKQPLVA